MKDYNALYDEALRLIHTGGVETLFQDNRKFYNDLFDFQYEYMEKITMKHKSSMSISIENYHTNNIKKVMKNINLACLQHITENTQLSQKEVVNNNKELFLKKNRDYGNSFEDFGFIGILIRLNDKINRLKSLHNKTNCHVEDESILDTIQDLYNYTIIALITLL